MYLYMCVYLPMVNIRKSIGEIFTSEKASGMEFSGEFIWILITWTFLGTANGSD